MNFKYLFSILVLCATPFLGDAQQYVSQKNSVGLNAGILAYSGRFSIGSSFSQYSSLAGSFYFSRRVYDKTFVRVEAMGGQMKADNREAVSQTDKPTGMFNSGIAELSVKGEYELLDLNMNRFSPYVIAGAGAYYLINYTSTVGEKTEGDKLGFVVPVGAGIKYKLNDRFAVTAEGSLRFFSKNLDGRTGTGITNPNKYYTFGIGAVYELSPMNSLW